MKEQDIKSITAQVQDQIKKLSDPAGSPAFPLDKFVTTVKCNLDDYEYVWNRTPPDWVPADSASVQTRTLAVERVAMEEIRHTIPLPASAPIDLADGSDLGKMLRRAVNRQLEDAIKLILTGVVGKSIDLTVAHLTRAASPWDGQRTKLLLVLQPIDEGIEEEAKRLGVEIVDVSKLVLAMNDGDGRSIDAILFDSEGPGIYRYQARPVEATVRLSDTGDTATFQIDERRALRKVVGVKVTRFATNAIPSRPF
jgi:hypothetical protein